MLDGKLFQSELFITLLVKQCSYWLVRNVFLRSLKRCLLAPPYSLTLNKEQTVSGSFLKCIILKVSTTSPVAFRCFRLDNFSTINLCSYSRLFPPVTRLAKRLAKISRPNTNMPSMFYWYCHCAKTHRSSLWWDCKSYSRFRCRLSVTEANCLKISIATLEMRTLILHSKVRHNLKRCSVRPWGN